MGSGAINGEGNYGFMLTDTDGQINGNGGRRQVPHKIWDKAIGEIIYDNQMGDAGDGFRRFRLGDRQELKVIKVNGLVELQPFEGASNRTSTVVLEKGEATDYPVTYNPVAED